MSIFNKKRKSDKVYYNRAGGPAFELEARHQLVTLLLTSFVKNQFYRKGETSLQEIKDLVQIVDPIFAAKAAIFARTELGMRSVTHALAAHIAPKTSGQGWGKAFYNKVIFRPDDMLEIFAYYQSLGNHKMPNAMKKGFAKAFDRFDAYQIAKYRATNKAIKLVDMVNLVHPVPTQKNAKALQALVDGHLKSKNTWEAKLTKAGQEAKNAADKESRKAEAWSSLIRGNTLGYFALLRNLRNLAEQAPDVLGDALGQLTDRKRIKNSMVLPFRFLSAQDAITQSKLPIRQKRTIQKALNKAFEIALDNIPVFPGRTLVVLDDSGSMTWGQQQLGKMPIEIGALFAAMLYKRNNADLMRFSDDASYKHFYFEDAAMSMAERLVKKARSAGTNFHAIFEKADKVYDRVIILSDMQGWMGQHTPQTTFYAYKKRLGADPFIYSFDLQGYGSTQLTGNKIFCLSGFSDKIFDVMQLLETDREALIHKIEQIDLM